MYAIRNKRTKKWLYGTWWQNGRVVQKTSNDQALVFERYEDAKVEFCCRNVGKNYEIIPVNIVETKEEVKYDQRGV